MKEARGLSIGTLSRLTGVNLETVRYYERIGIMPAPSRTAGGYRVYSVDHSRRLAFIRRARQLGFSLNEIRVLLELVDGHAYTCAQVHGMMVGHLSEIDRKIADLRRLRKVMATMAAQCTRNRVPECPVIEALFRDPIGMRSGLQSRPRSARSAKKALPT